MQHIEHADGDLPLDTVFTILRVERRRRTVSLLAAGAVETLSDLAETIGAAEYGHESAADLRAQERKRVYIALYQTHLPMLRDAGVVEWDRRSGDVSLGPNAQQLSPYLSVAAGECPCTVGLRDVLRSWAASAPVIGRYVADGPPLPTA